MSQTMNKKISLKNKLWIILPVSLLILISFFIQERSLLTDTSRSLQGLSLQSWLGTDALGRDYLLRNLVAFRNTFFICTCALVISFFVAIILATGFVHLPRRLQSVFLRTIEVTESIPDILLIAVVSVSLQEILGSEFINVVLGISLGGIFIFLRYFINLFQAELAKPYYESASVMGVNLSRKLGVYLWPNQKENLKQYALIYLPTFLTIESALSFLGLGVQPPHPTIGTLLLEGWKYLQIQPSLFFIPGVLLMIINWSTQRAVISRQV